MSSKTITIECPICMKTLSFDKEYEADGHIDECLTRQLIDEEHKQRESQTVETIKTIAAITGPQGFSFSIACPYAGCNQAVDFGAYYQHVLAMHNAAPHHRYACPMCAIQSDTAYHVNENTNLYQHLQMFHATGFNPGLVQRSMPLPRQDVFSEEEYSSIDDEDMEEKNSEDDSASEESLDEEENAIANNNFLFGQNRRLSMSGMLESPIQVRSVPIGIQQVTRSNSQPNSQPRRMSIVSSPPLAFGLMGRPEYAVSTFEADTKLECSICYCEFVKGSVSARLSCLCLYHKECIDSWFSRKQTNKCPYHQDATPKS
eukprot:TRINITY_DN5215_c0_g1_i1.p1 TRINITY_DN5215_c0_g1~~TRINITY_DN5215_c0_g1_i1.p1  ORF type:complete len:316 (-),score=10.09 TRINITY_DN5215_c0_g1_i1:25-972(-)